MSRRLEGRVAAISGSSRGIGLAVARAFVEEGAKVAVNSRDAAVADRVAEELGHGAVGIGADVSTEAGAQALVGGTIEAFGRIDVLVNNAGMSAAVPTLELDLARWQKVVDLNMTSVFVCSREAARHMLEAKGGSIINTASIMSFSSFPRRLAYGATKAAVAMMTRNMAAEWAPTIRVNAVAPGYTRTEMVEKLATEGRIDLDAIMRRTPLRRIAAPEEMAGAYIFLASDEASFVTGQTIAVDGGWLAYGAFEGA
ncbi:MAG TPA: glucose 1-dehydrogenase [Candidatus Dormibacteraeota bacterium]|nr:glucose 1-dehydrogenase [Candidatus Dormibacteraeota bacterium]